jgi:hypothetical protein
MQNGGQQASGAQAGGLTRDGNLSQDRMGKPGDPNDWVLRAAEMRTAEAEAAPGGDRQAGDDGAASGEPAEQPALQ